MSAKDGGYAFPKDVAVRGQYGMTLRDYFAAHAMTSMANCEAKSPTGANGEETYKGVAVRAYYMADAMLKAREVLP